MDLTPEERMLRDYYLSKATLSFASHAFEIAVCVISIGAFAYGFFVSEDGRPLMVVAFSLTIIAVIRSIYSGAAYAALFRSLIRKYEAALKKEPNQTPEPTAPSGRGSS